MTDHPATSPTATPDPLTAEEERLLRFARSIDGAPIDYGPVMAVDRLLATLDAEREAAARREPPAGLDAAHLQRQRDWSERTFGPGPRTKGVVDHIRKELAEVVQVLNDPHLGFVDTIEQVHAMARAALAESESPALPEPDPDIEAMIGSIVERYGGALDALALSEGLDAIQRYSRDDDGDMELDPNGRWCLFKEVSRLAAALRARP